MHLDKWRKPIPCPGSHTGAADSAHHARPPQNQRTARPGNTRSESRAQEVGRDMETVNRHSQNKATVLSKNSKVRETFYIERMQK